ncbi:MAG: dihydropteroate synthase [Planctomycetota bacterium]
MLVIAERINATRKRVRKAIVDRNAALIEEETLKQLDAGADYIDANAGIEAGREPDDLKWLVETIQSAADCVVALDSTNAEALKAALPLHKGRPMVNSITGEDGRHEEILPLVKEYGALLVALTIGPEGMPTTVDERLAAAGYIVDLVAKQDIPLDRVYFDPIIYSAATDAKAGTMAIETVQRIKAEFPGVHVTCGLSNISFGLPSRNVLNRAYLAMLMAAGLDSAIMDPTRPHMMSAVLASEAILGRDDFCMNYITAERAGKLD